MSLHEAKTDLPQVTHGVNWQSQDLNLWLLSHPDALALRRELLLLSRNCALSAPSALRRLPLREAFLFSSRL